MSQIWNAFKSASKIKLGLANPCTLYSMKTASTPNTACSLKIRTMSKSSFYKNKKSIETLTL